MADRDIICRSGRQVATMTKALGLRCWNDRISFVVLEGTQERPVLVVSRQRFIPSGVSRAQGLRWVRDEVREIINSHEPDVAGFKAIEGNSRSKDMHRGEVEGVLQEAGISHDLGLEIVPRVRRQIKRDLAWFEGEARYVERAVNEVGYDQLDNARLREAAVVALCLLPSEGE